MIFFCRIELIILDENKISPQFICWLSLFCCIFVIYLLFWWFHVWIASTLFSFQFCFILVCSRLLFCQLESIQRDLKLDRFNCFSVTLSQSFKWRAIATELARNEKRMQTNWNWIVSFVLRCVISFVIIQCQQILLVLPRIHLVLIRKIFIIQGHFAVNDTFMLKMKLCDDCRIRKFLYRKSWHCINCVSVRIESIILCGWKLFHLSIIETSGRRSILSYHFPYLLIICCSKHMRSFQN